MSKTGGGRGSNQYGQKGRSRSGQTTQPSDVVDKLRRYVGDVESGGNPSSTWLAQARSDLDMATSSAEQGHHDWACFAAHQSAEMALKALHRRLGNLAWGHNLTRLLDDLPIGTPRRLRRATNVLNNYYVASRYPDDALAIAPFERFDEDQSKEAIRHADGILEFVRAHMA